MKTVVRRISAPEAIVCHLLERIRRGDFGPGARLPSERELQEELGVGRLSLREALARLSALGVIRVEHGRGAFVQKQVNGEALNQALVPLFPERSVKALQDLVDARALIEGELAALAAARRSKADVDRLRAVLDQPGATRQSDSGLAELDYRFHREVAEVADNEFLAVMLEALSDHIRNFLLHYVRAHGDADSVIDRHRPILEAIATGDPERARDCARKHVEICKSSLEAYVKSRQPAGNEEETS